MMKVSVSIPDNFAEAVDGWAAVELFGNRTRVVSSALRFHLRNMADGEDDCAAVEMMERSRAWYASMGYETEEDVPVRGRRQLPTRRNTFSLPEELVELGKKDMRNRRFRNFSEEVTEALAEYMAYLDEHRDEVEWRLPGMTETQALPDRLDGSDDYDTTYDYADHYRGTASY